MKHFQPDYNPVLSDLYKRAQNEYKMAHQWKNVHRLGWAQNYVEHLTKALALIELLENVTVCNIGGGYCQEFNTTIDQRLDSFKLYKEIQEIKL